LAVAVPAQVSVCYWNLITKFSICYEREVCVFLEAEKPNMFAEYSFFLSILSRIALQSSSQYWKDTKKQNTNEFLWSERR
jgi:hypothetical protein